jgi:glycosyltransferase involved in cell wall biosynthesis
MKVAIGYHLQNSAWGGGNQFGNALSCFLKEQDHHVTFSLDTDDIDIILITDPRWRSPCVSFGPHDVFYYLLRTTTKPVVVHRINECDQRKNTRTMNARLRLCNYLADYTVYISKWLSSLPLSSAGSSSSIILNGADPNIFYPNLNNSWKQGQKIRLVTHHWSPHLMKGFDVYDSIDKLLCDPAWNSLLDFTYIGNLPSNYSFANSRHIPPLDSASLADVLRSNHIYITASINEPAGMHHIEAAMCGLPIIYRNSGALPEYCNGFGLPFDNHSYIDALLNLIRDYSKYRTNILTYPHSSSVMCQSYLNLFQTLVNQRDSITANRNLFRSPARFLLSALPLP